MITGDQLLLHAIGDYILQSDWMANWKTRWWLPACLHVVCYTLPWLVLTRSLPALLVIAGSHYLIDRYRLARYACFFKNVLLAPKGQRPLAKLYGDNGWNATNGYPSNTPAYLAVWLLIIADNVMHVLCNGLALHFLA